MPWLPQHPGFQCRVLRAPQQGDVKHIVGDLEKVTSGVPGEGSLICWSICSWPKDVGTGGKRNPSSGPLLSSRNSQLPTFWMGRSI